jgi:cyclophilin family peptidyl-prolyl cis-trans isomerase/HEAT repeat protein
MNAVQNESDWRVKVNILNAIGNTDKAALNVSDSLIDNIFSIAEKEKTNVSITALAAASKIFEGLTLTTENKEKTKSCFLWYFDVTKAVDWQVKSEAVKSYSRIFKDEAKNDLLSYYSTTDNYDIKADIIRSLSNMTDGKIFREARDSINVDVQRYNASKNITSGNMISGNEMAKLYKTFVELCVEVSARVNSEDKNTIRLILSEFAGSKNPAITDICLSALKDSSFSAYAEETKQILIFDLNEISMPQDMDLILMHIQVLGEMKAQQSTGLLEKYLKSDNYDIAKTSADALKNITGSDYENQITAQKYRTDFDWDKLNSIFFNRFANIKTNRGDIKIELLPDAAPFTVLNFVKLAEKNYFNNIIFHRVVPNFVIQTGDPTGTGYGGPGYSIRSELSPLHYETGVVGMASSGKDTEGSQFFITHSSTPHLDSRYTIFAKVTDGMNVVDEIQIGDYIETITFSDK